MLLLRVWVGVKGWGWEGGGLRGRFLLLLVLLPGVQGRCRLESGFVRRLIERRREDLADLS